MRRLGVLFLVLLTACTSAAPATQVAQVATALPPTVVPATPTEAPIATWIAQGIPSDTLIEVTYISPMQRDSRESIQITADGSATYDYYSAPGQPSRRAGQLSPETLKRVILAFEEKRFFYLRSGAFPYDSTCLYDIASSAYAGRGVDILDSPSTQVKIRINGISKDVRYNPCGYDLAGSSLAEAKKGETNLRSLFDLIRETVKTLPPATPAPASM